MRLFFFVICLFSLSCSTNSVVVNESLLNKISKGEYKHNQILIDSIFGGKWDSLILMPPYFPTDNLSNCGIEKHIISKMKSNSPLQLDVEEFRIYAVCSDKVYSLNKTKYSYMLIGLAWQGCPIIKKGKILDIKNIAKDSLHKDYRIYKIE